MERALTVLTRKENRRELCRRLTARAGLKLEPGESWLLMRIERHPDYTADQLAREPSIPPDRVRTLLRVMAADGLVTSADGSPEEHPVLTDAGRTATKRLLDARRARLTELLDGWLAEAPDELVETVR